MNKLLTNRKNLIIVILSIILIGAIVFLIISQIVKSEKKNLTVITASNRYSLSVEFARTFEEQQTGLMNRKSMPQDAGMLFIFSVSKVQSFWMKDTYIPLDIIFLDENKTVVNVAENAQPCVDQGNNCPVYLSSAPSLYVLEVNSGWTKAHNVNTKTTIEF